MRLVRLAAWVVAAAVLTSACGGAPETGEPVESMQAAYSAPVSACTQAAIRAGAPDSAQVMLDRAYKWIDNQIMYCRCTEPGSSHYRADCSGYVSYIWSLPTPGNTTYTFPGGKRDNGRAQAIGWSDLTIGDGLNFGGNRKQRTGHSMLFAGWLNSAHTRLCSIEETHHGTAAHIGKHKLSDPGSWWGGTGTFKTIFQPMRKTGYTPSSLSGTDGGATPDADAGGASGTDAGAGGTGTDAGASGASGTDAGALDGSGGGGSAGASGSAGQTGLGEPSGATSNESGGCSVSGRDRNVPGAPLWLVAGVLALSAERRRRRR